MIMEVLVQILGCWEVVYILLRQQGKDMILLTYSE